MDDLPRPSDLAISRGSLRSPAVWLATGLGIGLIGPAPGTLGALWGLLLAWGISHLPPLTAAIVVIGFLAAGVLLCTRAARSLGGKDPQAIVWDELATVPIVFSFVPLTSWKVAFGGYALHRLFDITKPWPCQQLERLPEGLGIMADDVAAAVYAAGALWAVMWLVR
ncbi:MAG: phosphatidylglycerophosphatase A [Pirellulales bacterium]